MTWGEALVTAPAERVVSLTEVKTFLRIDENENDSDLARLISVATERVQNLTRRQLITATRKLSLPGFPCGRQILLPWAPLQSVTSVKYRATEDDALTTYASTNYRVATEGEPGFVELKYNYLWPATSDRFGAVEVEYVCGYGDTSLAVPEALRHAVLMTVGHLYEYRSDVSKQQVLPVPNGVQSLLDQYTLGDEFIRYDLP